MFTVITTAFLSKSPNRKKISKEHVDLCGVDISVDGIIKFINSKTNNEFQVIMALQQNFLN